MSFPNLPVRLLGNCYSTKLPEKKYHRDNGSPFLLYYRDLHVFRRITALQSLPAGCNICVELFKMFWCFLLLSHRQSLLGKREYFISINFKSTARQRNIYWLNAYSKSTERSIFMFVEGIPQLLCSSFWKSSQSYTNRITFSSLCV